MTAATIVTPAGNKVRTQSNRRFVVVTDHFPTDAPAHSAVVRRSDSVETARAVRDRMGPVAHWTDGSRSTFHVFDTVTKQEV